MRILNVCWKFLYDVCERKAMQNIWRHYFLTPGGKGALWDKLAHNGCGNLVKMKDSSLPLVAYIRVTLSNFFYTFYLKKDTKDGF